MKNVKQARVVGSLFLLWQQQPPPQRTFVLSFSSLLSHNCSLRCEVSASSLEEKKKRLAVEMGYGSSVIVDLSLFNYPEALIHYQVPFSNSLARSSS